MPSTPAKNAGASVIAARLLALCIFTVLALPQAAFGQSAADTIRTWGLLGTWATDCARPVSKENYRYTYAVRNGRAFHDRNWGEGRDSMPIRAATIKPDGSLVVVLYLEWLSHSREVVEVKSADGNRTRTLSNRNLKTGEYSVRDGKFMHNGEPTEWIDRCR